MAEPAARRRSSFALHAGGVPRGSRGGDADAPMGDAVAPDVSTVTLFAHAPGDVMSNVVKTAPLRVPRPVEYRHLQPVSVGLAVRWGFSRGLSLAAGANYTLLRSEARLEGSGRWVDQRLHFVGLPVRLDWQYLEHGPLSLYIGAGGQVEKCVAARLDGQRVDEPGVQWSLTAAAGVQCGLGGVVALYAEPEAAWYVNDTRLRTSRTDHPLSFTLRFGVRFSF
ncbi:MAG: porin family protein [Alistipes sp.]|nr:porin family protein [Alistipes sp.]